MKKVLMVIFIFMMFPCYLYASSLMSYNNTLSQVNNRIRRFNKYSDYLDISKTKYLCELVNNKLACSTIASFTNSGYINYDEYLLSGGLNSYLNDGVPYYTMTMKNGKIRLIVGAYQNKDGYVDADPASSNGYTRITEYINKNSELAGTGTYMDPWTFVDNTFPPEWLQDPDISFGQPNGTKGDSNWFRSNVSVNVVTQMPKESIIEFKYCITTSSTCTPSTSISDTSKIVSISTEGNSNKICASIKTVANKEAFICSSDQNKYNAMYKIDKTSPTCRAVSNPSNYSVTDVVESLSGLPTNAYSWTGNNDYSTVTTTLATDAKTYTAYVKDIAGNVGTCQATCLDWGTPNTYTTTGTCTNSITPFSKVTGCAALNTCSKAATVSSYSCPFGSYVGGTNYCSGSINKYESDCKCHITKGTTYSNINSASACSTKCGGSRLTCSTCGGTWAKYNYISSTKKCECRTVCRGEIIYGYSCNTGGSNQGDSWCKYTATPNYSCNSGYSLNETNCVKNNQTSCEAGYTATPTGSKQYSIYSRACSIN